MIEDRNHFAAQLNENFIGKQAPVILALCAEFTPILSTSNNQKLELKEIFDKFNEENGKVKADPRFFKPVYLIYAFMNRYSIGPNLIEDALFIIQTCPKIIDALCKFSMAVPNVNTGQGPKSIGARCAMSLVEFSQHFLQGLWYSESSPIRQLGSIDDETWAAILKKKKKMPKFSSLVRKESRKENLGVFPEELHAKIDAELDNFPDIDVNIKVGLDLDDAKTVDDKLETEIPSGNIACIMVILTRRNDTKKDEDFRYLHSTMFPFNEKEKFYLALTDDKNHVIGFDVAVFGKKTHVKKFTFPAFQEGTFKFKLHVKPNGYLDLDSEHDVEFTVKPAIQNKYEISKSDQKKMKEGSLFDMMAKGIYQKDGDSDEELEEGAEHNPDSDEELEEDEDKKEKKDKKKDSEISTNKEKAE